MERTLVDVAARSHVLLCSVDSYILKLRNPVDLRRHVLWGIIAQRDTMVNSFARVIEKLGLQRRAKAIPSITEYMAAHDQTKAAT